MFHLDLVLVFFSFLVFFADIFSFFGGSLVSLRVELRYITSYGMIAENALYIFIQNKTIYSISIILLLAKQMSEYFYFFKNIASFCENSIDVKLIHLFIYFYLIIIHYYLYLFLIFFIIKTCFN